MKAPVGTVEDRLPDLIHRIGVEREGLRNVTESSLRVETETSNVRTDHSETVSMDLESRYKELGEARSNMINNISCVHQVQVPG